WLLAAAGALMWGLGLILVFGVVDKFTPGGLSGMPKAPAGAVPLDWMFHHYMVSGSLLFALSVGAIFVGVRFLRLEPWARKTLEAGGWILLAASLGTVFVLTQPWQQSAATMPVGRLFSFLTDLAFWGVLPFVFVLLLRSRAVVAAFRAPDRG